MGVLRVYFNTVIGVVKGGRTKKQKHKNQVPAWFCSPTSSSNTGATSIKRPVPLGVF